MIMKKGIKNPEDTVARDLAVVLKLIKQENLRKILEGADIAKYLKLGEIK